MMISHRISFTVNSISSQILSQFVGKTILRISMKSNKGIIIANSHQNKASLVNSSVHEMNLMMSMKMIMAIGIKLDNDHSNSSHIIVNKV